MSANAVIDLGIDATDEERRDRRDSIDGLSPLQTSLQGAEISLRYCSVVLDREEHRNVDVDALEETTFDCRPTLARPGNLDHHIRPIQRLPEATRLGHRALSVVSQPR